MKAACGGCQLDGVVPTFSRFLTESGDAATCPSAAPTQAFFKGGAPISQLSTAMPPVADGQVPTLGPADLALPTIATKTEPASDTGAVALAPGSDDQQQQQPTGSLGPGVVPQCNTVSGAPSCTGHGAPGGSGPSAAASGSLTIAQRSELAMAKRRADKAAAGKRTRVLSNLLDMAHDGSDASAMLCDEEMDIQKHGAEIEAKIAQMGDEKEAKRLKRLLRNRISAQQARERKKTYVQSLEGRATEMEDRCTSLEDRVRTLECENKVLRRIIMNMKQGMVPQ